LSIQHDEGRARAPWASLKPPAIAAARLAPRSIFRAIAQFVETVRETLIVVATWLLSELLDGCAAYALAMYGLPAVINDAEADHPPASRRSDALAQSSRPALPLISPDIRASKIISPPDPVRSAQPPSGRSSWRTAVIAPAVWLLSKIRERSAWRRAIAELRCLDDQSLRDIGISRTDIGHIA